MSTLESPEVRLLLWGLKGLHVLGRGRALGAMADVLDDEMSAVPNVDGTDSDDELPSSGGAATDDSQPASSALHENIRRKGANSYYYAHKTKIGTSYAARWGACVRSRTRSG